MTTANDIKNVAQNTEENPSRLGCFVLTPPVRLKYKPSGKIVTATMVDIDGKYPNTVHTEEMGYWYPADEFEIGTEVVTVEPAPIEDLPNS